jgi:hypothetical protein
MTQECVSKLTLECPLSLLAVDSIFCLVGVLLNDYTRPNKG